MATRRIVPRGNSEGSIGSGEKHWESAYIGNVANVYDNVAAMIDDAENFQAGDQVKTLWYLTPGDGAGADYVIEETTVNTVLDGITHIRLNDFFNAHKIYREVDFVANSFDELKSYPTCYCAYKDLDSSDPVVSATSFTNQSMCGEKDANGVIQYLYVLNDSRQSGTVCEIAKFHRVVSEDGYVTWEFVKHNYIFNSLGHADRAFFMDGYIYVLIGSTAHKIDKDTLEETIFTYDNHNGTRGSAYDDVTETIIVSSTSSGLEHPGRMDTLNFYDKNFNFIKSITVDTMDNYICQNMCAYNGIIYIIACPFAYPNASVDSGLANISYIMCYDYDGNFIKNIPFDIAGEIEGVEVDSTGYIYGSFNGDGFIEIREAPLFKNAIQSLRTPVHGDMFASGDNYKNRNKTIYVNSCNDAKNFGVGLGLASSPFYSLNVLSECCSKLNDVGKGFNTLNIILQHTHVPNKYDSDVHLCGLNNSTVNLKHATYTNFSLMEAGVFVINAVDVYACTNVALTYLKLHWVSNWYGYVQFNGVIIDRGDINEWVLLSNAGKLYFASNRTDIKNGRLKIYTNTVLCGDDATFKFQNVPEIYHGHNLGIQYMSDSCLWYGTYTIPDFVTSGLVTSGATELKFQLCFDRPIGQLVNVNNISIDGRIYVRDSTAGPRVSNATISEKFNVSMQKTDVGGLRVSLIPKSGSGITFPTNNVVLSVEILDLVVSIGLPT